MLHDFEMIVRKFPDRPNIKIYPIADVHLGAIECMEGVWGRFRRMIEEDPNAYLILAGDLINNATRNSVGDGIFRSTMSPREQKRAMVEHLKPLRNRILCMVGGNHERRTDRDTDSSPAFDIASKLDIEDVYRDSMAFLKLQFGDMKKSGDRNPTYTFAVTHGAGSSIYTTASPVRAERMGMAIDGVDALVVGHIHKPQTFPVGKYVVDKYNNKVTMRPFRVFVCTSWMEGAPYGLQKMMPPTVFNLSHYELRGDRKAIGAHDDEDFNSSV